jgi:xylan 1,4-beta-xylosidase
VNALGLRHEATLDHEERALTKSSCLHAKDGKGTNLITRREFLGASAAVLVGSAAENPARLFAANSNKNVQATIDLGGKASSLPHFWEKSAGSDRAVVGLREQWRQDLIRCQGETGIQSVRCHGLFDDEMGIALQGAGKLNFLYVDQIYDFMLDHGVRPFVELSFMPEAFASSANRIFFYKGNTSPPKDWKNWYDLVHAFTDHCVKRYGLAEVRSWKFEVWNEPNIGFWAGSQEQYFELYKQSATAVKEVDKDLQVGGPATAQLAWIPDLIAYCNQKDVPIDFVSTHVYPNDPQQKIFGRANMYPFEQVIPKGLEQIKNQVQSSTKPNLPIWLTEWSSQNPAFIADTIKNCIGLTECMAYWTFSNVFEEQGVPSGLFNGTFGMLDQWGIARPSLHAFSLLHKLGEELIPAGDGPLLATRRTDGSIAILVWNLIPTKDAGHFANGAPFAAGGEAQGFAGATLNLQLSLQGYSGAPSVKVTQVNGEVGNAQPAWKAMGSPAYPTSQQIQQLRESADLPTPEVRSLPVGNSVPVSMVLPPNGIALLEFAK